MSAPQVKLDRILHAIDVWMMRILWAWALALLSLMSVALIVWAAKGS